LPKRANALLVVILQSSILLSDVHEHSIIAAKSVTGKKKFFMVELIRNYNCNVSRDKKMMKNLPKTNLKDTVKFLTSSTPSE